MPASASAPLLLALDTATGTASIALFDGQRVLAETTWVAGREHSTQLLPELERIVTRLGLALPEVTGIVVARGPGSFTGVRVALSIGKGLAVGLAVPLWGISTLDVLAHQAGPTDLPVRPLLDAGRGRFATALYRHGRPAEPMRAIRSEELVDLLAEPTVLVGDLAKLDREQLNSMERAVVAPPSQSLRRAGFLAELGWRASQQGEAGDPALVDAVYLPPTS